MNIQVSDGADWDQKAFNINADVAFDALCVLAGIPILDRPKEHQCDARLSQLDDDEKRVYPWHRVVGADQSLGRPKRHPDGRSQADLLLDEGILVVGNRVQTAFDQIFLSAEELPSGLPRQVRPPDAPSASQGRPRRRGPR